MFLYDGHGSTRGLVDALGFPISSAQDGSGQPVIWLAYDAYGNALNFAAATALTTLLYSGEHLDRLTNLQYLRARWYDPSSGRFTRLDPFPGNVDSPRSLHYYLYGYGDPVAYVDPSGCSGQFSIGGLLVTMGIQGLIGAVISGGIAYAVHRNVKQALWAAGWGFVIGAALGGAFYGGAWWLHARALAAAAASSGGVAPTVASATFATLEGTVIEDAFLAGRVAVRLSKLRYVMEGRGGAAAAWRALGYSVDDMAEVAATTMTAANESAVLVTAAQAGRTGVTATIEVTIASRTAAPAGKLVTQWVTIPVEQGGVTRVMAYLVTGWLKI